MKGPAEPGAGRRRSGIPAGCPRGGMERVRAARDAVGRRAACNERVARSAGCRWRSRPSTLVLQLVAGRRSLAPACPYAPVLLEAADRTRLDAWLHFTALLVREQHAAQRRVVGVLLDETGRGRVAEAADAVPRQARRVVELRRRRREAAVARALAPLRAGGGTTTAERVRQPDLVSAVRALVDLWRVDRRVRRRRSRRRIDAAERWLAQADADPAEDFRAACLIVLTKGNGAARHPAAGEDRRQAARAGAHAALCRKRMRSQSVGCSNCWRRIAPGAL